MVRRRDVDLEKAWDVESATGKGVLYVTKSKNETTQRLIPPNKAAREAIERMLKRSDDLDHTDVSETGSVLKRWINVHVENACAFNGPKTVTQP